MKTANAKELNEKYKDCPSREKEIIIDGRVYVVVSHFVGDKDLDKVVYKNAYNQAMDEVLRT
jgi:conserved domain protein